jgi:hypothetical protein
MLILENLVLNWYQYQICYGIVLDYKSIFVVRMTVYCLLESL